MFKKVTGLLVLMFVFGLVLGCGTKGESNKQGTTKNKKVVKIAYTITPSAAPQPLIDTKYKIFNEQLKELGKEAKFETTRSLDNVWPLMDSKTDAPDFVYLPMGNFATYFTSTSRFGGSDKYAIIAGSSNGGDSLSLVVRPEINSLKDLAGKKVAIANNRYSDEYQLNEALKKEGLETDSVGGEVKIVWEDIVIKQQENFGKGKYDAIVVYGSSSVPDALGKVPGSKVLVELGEGENIPKNWLVVKKELIKKDPELVKTVLKAHIMATDKALTEQDNIPAINREIRLKWFEDHNAVMEPILKQEKIEKYIKTWKKIEITNDPNITFTKDLFSFLNKKGLVKGKTVKDILQVDLLNQTLNEMGKTPIKE